MFSKLISIALVIIPFISVRGQDIRELKLALALGISLVLCLLGFYQGIFRIIPKIFIYTVFYCFLYIFVFHFYELFEWYSLSLNNLCL